MRTTTESERLFVEAKKHLVGGVNSPVRAYRDYDFAPPFIDHAEGAYLWDVDGNKYIDFVGSWGPLILGHAHPQILEAINAAARKGTSFGAPTEAEIRLGSMVKDAFPSMDLVRFVNSGTEATMSAIRLARGFTGRDKIIKFNGCYHGHSDFLLVKAGSGAASFAAPDSAGVPADFAKHTLIAEYNDSDGVRELIGSHGDEVAAIIVEPIAANMGCVPPRPEFLKNLREICNAHGIVLIFDEVVTGFRVAYGGAQELYGVTPDLTCLGKIIGGGLPMGAYGGRKEIMEKVSPLGTVYQAGTLSGNPLCVASGIAMLELLKNEGTYASLGDAAERLTKGLSGALTQKDIPHRINRVGSMFSIFFTAREVHSFEDASAADRTQFDTYFKHLLANGIYIAPSPFETSFVNLAHTSADLDAAIEVTRSL